MNSSAKNIEKLIYQAMKTETRKRGFKLSAEQDIYKKEGEYFYSSFYAVIGYADDTIKIITDIGVKYWRFDELKDSILNPDDPVHFTDKIRANSLAMCPCNMPRKTIELKWDGTEDSISEVCEKILDHIIGVQKDFVSDAEKNYGNLCNYYMSHEDEYSFLAGLAYLEAEKYEDALRCFSSENKRLDSNLRSFSAVTEEQKRRLQRDGIQFSEYDGKYEFYKNDKSIFIDYVKAKIAGEKWSDDIMKYGMPLNTGDFILSKIKNIFNHKVK